MITLWQAVSFCNQGGSLAAVWKAFFAIDMAFELPTLKTVSLNDLASFKLENVKEQVVIGHGVYGIVYKGEFIMESFIVVKLWW